MLDPKENGTGPEVEVVHIGDDGQEREILRLKKIVRSESDWVADLAPAEFCITRQQATENPFTGEHWNSHEPGVYRCVCCGTALFESVRKFESGTGWPSFTAPVDERNIATRADRSHAAERVEVLCVKCDAHLGHVFPDGPGPAGLRYCINSAALKFVRNG